MSFSVEQALAIATAKHNKRMQKREKTMYSLFFTNSTKGTEGVIHGTKKSIIEEFKRTRNSYRYAFITKKGQSEVLYVYNSSWGTKFMQMRDKKQGVRSK